MQNSIVESLMVIRYNPSHNAVSVEVNAPCKILSVLIRCLKNEIMQEKIKTEKINYNDLNEEDEDNDNNNFDEDDEDKEESNDKVINKKRR